MVEEMQKSNPSRVSCLSRKTSRFCISVRNWDGLGVTPVIWRVGVREMARRVVWFGKVL